MFDPDDPDRDTWRATPQGGSSLAATARAFRWFWPLLPAALAIMVLMGKGQVIGPPLWPWATSFVRPEALLAIVLACVAAALHAIGWGLERKAWWAWCTGVVLTSLMLASAFGSLLAARTSLWGQLAILLVVMGQLRGLLAKATVAALAAAWKPQTNAQSGSVSAVEQ
jgi:hypothetical protein